jgi:hypothetical protein
MKKLIFIFSMIIATIAMTSQVSAQAMGATPSPLTKVFFKNYSIASAVGTVTIPFYQSENVSKLLLQVDWKTITGDSAQVKVWVSANENFLNATQINTLATTRWRTGEGTNITKWEAIDVAAYPVNYVRVTLDTLTGITTGTATVSIKPLFNY